MADNSKLFLDAFAGKTEVQKQAEQGKPLSPDQRTEAFQAAFGKPAEKPLPTALVGQNWRWDMTKLSKLPPAQAYLLGQYEGVPYRELPAWIQDGGYVKVSDSEKKYQKEMLKETGFTQSERNELVNHALNHSTYLGDLMAMESFKGTQALDDEIDRVMARFGREQVLDILQSEMPDAAEQLQLHLQKREALAKVAEEQEAATSVKAEMQAVADKLGINPWQQDQQQLGSEVDE